MDHVCDTNSANFNIPDLFTCGVCSKAFNTICLLHLHLTRHSSGGSYHYDNVLKVAFPKYDSICTSTQTNDSLQKCLVETRFTRKVSFLEDKKLSNILRNEHREDSNSTDSMIFPKTTISIFKTDKERIKECSVNVPKLSEVDENTFVRTKERGSTKYGSDIPLKIDTNSEEKLHPKYPSERSDTDVLDAVDDGNIEDTDKTVGNKSNLEQKSDDMFRIPDTDPFKSKKKMAKSLSKDKVVKGRFFERLYYNNNQKKKKPTAVETHIQNLEIRTTGSVENDCQKGDAVNDTDNETDELVNKSYFYGKIITTSFIIERYRSREMISKGEKKGESNQIVVDGTWYPDSEYLDDSLLSGGKCFSDDLENSKIKGLYEMKQAKEEYKGSKKKLKKEQKSDLKCDQCSKIFKHLRHFEGHMNVHAGLTPYMCQYCGKGYANRTTLQMHEKLLHSDRSTWFTCSVCESSFATPARLGAHELTHSIEYVHTCQICNKSYKNQNLLKRHQAYTHSNKKYRCKNCRQSFDTIENRDLHQSKKHKSKEIKCGTCGQQFTSERSKVRHEKIHKGIKPHQCHICPRRFLQKTPFWVHMEKHHDLTKADLIRLFPKKHLGRNHQHLIKEMDHTNDVESDVDDGDDVFNDDEHFDDNNINDDISDNCFVDDDLLFDSPVDLVKL